MIGKRIAVPIAVCALLGGALAAHAGTEPRFGDDRSRWAYDGECDDPRFEGAGSAGTQLDNDRAHDATDCKKLFEQGRVGLRNGDGRHSDLGGAAANGARIEHGNLQNGDDVLMSGEYADTFRFDGSSGHRAVVDLRSADFDPYVVVRTPSGAQFDNDDYGDDAGRALVALELDESGEYEVVVTSFSEGETGAYNLRLVLENDAAATRRRDRNGELDLGDETLTTGEYVDTYRFQGWPGQHLSLDLESDDFDTYLILKEPHGGQVENDDTDESGPSGHSHIERDLSEAGVYSVLVTSYEPGEIGSYRLEIHPSGRAGDEAAPAQHTAVPLTVSLRTR
ncbi:MAG TPA: hypothetical protein VE907_20200 [Gammaproteobacteria bacterium]|nr:hypothetical protein [Gammaproteobacteria bacterium]